MPFAPSSSVLSRSSCGLLPEHCENAQSLNRASDSTIRAMALSTAALEQAIAEVDAILDDLRAQGCTSFKIVDSVPQSKAAGALVCSRLTHAAGMHILINSM